jgi:pimeloyl-ACP methyl ester carboxylesterase
MPPDLDQWRALGHAGAFGAYRVFCVDSAPADTTREGLVLIHGFPTASWDFSRLWPALTGRFRVLACDLLGFGFSSKPRGHAYSIIEQADLVESVAVQHGLRRFHVLAHDYGDSVAQELLARDTARTEPALRSVCFLNGGLFPETHRPRPIQRLLRGPLGPLIGRLLTRRAFARSMTATFGPRTPPSAADIDAFWTLITHDGGQRRAHELIRYIDERVEQRERWLHALRQARCPLALIDGAADPVSGAHMVARYRELVGKGYVAELPGIGHYPQVEAPEVVLDHYWRFLGESGLATSPAFPAAQHGQPDSAVRRVPPPQ